MIRKVLVAFLAAISILNGLVCTAAAWGPIKHMTILEEVIRHPDLSAEMRSTSPIFFLRWNE